MDQELRAESGIAGRVALVTGGAGVGIGRAIASRLLLAGATVVIADCHRARTAAAVAALTATHGDRVIGVDLDVTDADAVTAAIDDIHGRVGSIGILVNNAALNNVKDVCDYTPEEWDRVFAVNVRAPWLLSRAVVPGMRAAGGGCIINLSTIAADIGPEIEAPYGASKGALNVLTRSLARSLGPADIRCNTVSMTLVMDTFFAGLDPSMGAIVETTTPLPRLVQSADIAEAVAFLASDRARSITGEILNVTAGQHMRP